MKNEYLLSKQREIYYDNKILVNALDHIAYAHPHDYQNFGDMVKSLQKQARTALIKTGDIEIG